VNRYQKKSEGIQDSIYPNSGASSSLRASDWTADGSSRHSSRTAQTGASAANNSRYDDSLLLLHIDGLLLCDADSLVLDGALGDSATRLSGSDGGSDGHLGWHDKAVAKRGVVDAVTLVTTVVVLENGRVVGRALIAELVIALGASHVVAAAVLLDGDVALGAQGSGAENESFGLLVVKVAEVLTGLTHVLAVLNFLGGSRGCLRASRVVDGTILVCVRVIVDFQAVPAEMSLASSAYAIGYQSLYKSEVYIGKRTYIACGGSRRFSRYAHRNLQDKLSRFHG
jgi:hypothetical protein